MNFNIAIKKMKQGFICHHSGQHFRANSKDNCLEAYNYETKTWSQSISNILFIYSQGWTLYKYVGIYAISKPLLIL
ncbi:MAG: hypothetical protein COB41_00195 [Proteobacteria bacterium]|nr:MAG: hypothetical protein COB41_00195 [Pseudomonadota bacterium]